MDDKITLTWMSGNQRLSAPLPKFAAMLRSDYSVGAECRWRLHDENAFMKHTLADLYPSQSGVQVGSTKDFHPFMIFCTGYTVRPLL